MMESIRLGARLRAARKAAGFKTSKAFLKKYKVPASTYSQHESGARTADDMTLKYYSKIFEVNYNWLKSGKGEPLNKAGFAQKNILEDELLDLTPPKNTVNSSINQKLLAEVLEKIIKLHQTDKSKYTLSMIVKKTIEIYADILNQSQGESLRTNTRKAINAYKMALKN